MFGADIDTCMFCADFRIATAKQEKEETWKKPLNQTNDIEVKKEDIKKVDTKVSEPKPDTKNNIKSPLPDQKNVCMQTFNS